MSIAIGGRLGRRLAVSFGIRTVFVAAGSFIWWRQRRWALNASLSRFKLRSGAGDRLELATPTLAR